MIKYIKRLFIAFHKWMEYNPPPALSSRGWRLFNEEFKKVAPVRYWIDNDFKRQVVLPITWKYQSVADWVRNRLIHRYHIVDTGLKPGYYDIDTIMLHSNFNLLKDYVEIELAVREDCNESWQQKYIPFYRIFYKQRHAISGIKHLEWASTLDDPTLPVYEQSVPQAISARETLILYNWWVNDRPDRVSLEPQFPVSMSGNEFDMFDMDIDRNTDEYKKYQADLAAADVQEFDWAEEDDQMLMRLVKIRKSLWS